MNFPIRKPSNRAPGALPSVSICQFFLAMCCAAATAHYALASEEREGPNTASRPAVSSPGAVALPAAAYFEFELGLLRAERGDDRRRDSLPFTAKLGLSDQWGVMINSELAVRRSTWDDNVYTGMGDTAFWLQYRLATSDPGSTVILAGGATSPTGNNGLGSGASDELLSLIYGADLTDTRHLDFSFYATRVGAHDDREGRMQYSWVATLSHALSDTWSVITEPSLNYQKGVPTSSQFLLGGSYQYSKQTIIDFAMARKLSNAGPDWQLMANLTTLVGRLW